MSSENDTRRLAIVAVIVLIAAAAFWLLVLSPKRKEADELGTKAESAQQSLTAAQAGLAEGEAARQAFPAAYRETVVLGKAVPAGDETASLIVQIVAIAKRSHISFDELALSSSGAEAPTSSTAQEAGPTSAPEPVPPTEAEASLLPLGAKIGAANLAIMPYKLEVAGSYEHVADFIHGIERLIKTHDQQQLSIDGRLLTMDGFSLVPGGGEDSGLTAEIGLNAYVTPPSTESGATGTEEAAIVEGEVAPAPEAESTTATPSSFPTEEAQ